MIFHEWTATFTTELTNALNQSGLRDGVCAREAAEATWAGIVGCHLLASGLDERADARLARVWQSAIRATAAEHMLARHYVALEDIHVRHRRSDD